MPAERFDFTCPITRADVLGNKYTRFEIANPTGHVMKYVISRTDPNERYQHTRFFVANLDSGFNYVGFLDPDTGNVVLTAGSRFEEKSRVVAVARYALAVIFGKREMPDGYEIRVSQEKKNGRKRCLEPLPKDPPF
jgi:hypothetical protein